MAKSKLFTPGAADCGCFVNPFSHPDNGGAGFAPTDKGRAPYPLSLGGSGAARTPAVPHASLTTSDDPE